MKKLPRGLSRLNCWCVLFVLLMVATCHGQRFVGAYGYAPYGGYMQRGRGNVLYGGVGWTLNPGSVYRGRGTNNYARRYVRVRRQIRGHLDDYSYYHLPTVYEMQLYDTIRRLEQIEYNEHNHFWDD